MPILNMVSWGCLLNASSNSIISGSGVVEIWKVSIFEEVGGIGVGSGDGGSGMVVYVGGLLVGMVFLWVTRLGICQMHEMSSSYSPCLANFVPKIFVSNIS